MNVDDGSCTSSFFETSSFNDFNDPLVFERASMLFKSLSLNDSTVLLALCLTLSESLLAGFPLLLESSVFFVDYLYGC